ncbi:MAG: nucleotidyltransferase family protein, partial [Bacteroidales bacterium]|nr:nucleotidyltransferase family protein [Bacteroidales bacterium]
LYGDKALTLKKLKGFLEVTDALRAAGIAFIPLKGFVLSQKIYGDPSFRFTGDVDLLLEPADIEKALSVLEKLGFVPSLFPWPSGEKQKQRLIGFRNQFALENPATGLDVELHWRLFYYPILPSGETDRIVKENLSTIAFQGRTFQVLNPELDLLFLLIHGGMHGWRRLKWLVDVHEIARQKRFDERRFSELVATYRAEKMIGLYNELIKSWFNPYYTLPDKGKSTAFLLQTAQKKISDPREGEYHSLGSLLGYLRFVMTAFPGVAYKRRILGYAWRSLWNKGGNPLGMLLPGKFLRKRYLRE